jgi:hypothetical protein
MAERHQQQAADCRLISDRMAKGFRTGSERMKVT